jgi:hypothetical protein
VRFLASLTVWSGLVAVEEPPPARGRARGRGGRRPPDPQPGRLVVVDEAGREWRVLPIADRWAALVRPWRNMVARIETATELALAELATLPAGQGAQLPGLVRRLVWRHPASFADAEAAAAVVGTAVATLHRLGIGAGAAGPVAGLTELGRAVLRGGASAELATIFPPAASECTVQADLRIIVTGPPEPALAAGLARLADLETASPARVYRVSEGSLRRALDDGMSAAEIAAFLDTRSPTGIPQNVTALIEDVGRRHGRLRVGSATLYLQADDPVLLAEVAANRRLRGLQVTLLAPTVAVVRGTDEAAALEALRRAGYMPGVDEAAETPRPTAGRRRRPPAAAVAPPPGLTADERRALAGRLLDAPAPSTPPRELADGELLSGITVSGRDDVERLMRLAVRSGRVVEIEYRNMQSGSVSTRVIEPRLAGDGTVVGWCRLRRDDRVFAFEGVRWARATGEAVAHVGLGLEDR